MTLDQTLIAISPVHHIFYLQLPFYQAPALKFPCVNSARTKLGLAFHTVYEHSPVKCSYVLRRNPLEVSVHLFFKVWETNKQKTIYLYIVWTTFPILIITKERHWWCGISESFLLPLINENYTAQMELQGLDLSSQLLATKMKQTKNTTDKIYEIVVFKTLDIR